jgi:hypothetical protein
MGEIQYVARTGGNGVLYHINATGKTVALGIRLI